ncbi:MAG: hypothetical protein OXR62_09040 [Ahrensia sp.]|nr:hypothetical protein [Ahrensia sp.]
MTDRPHDFVETTLRQIQASLREQTRRFDALDEELKDLRRGQEEFLRNSIFAMGTAGIADQKVNAIEAELEDVRARLTKLEENA